MAVHEKNPRVKELAIALRDILPTCTIKNIAKIYRTTCFPGAFNGNCIFVKKKRHPLTQHQLVLHGRANRKRVAESIAERITKSTSAMLLICQSVAEQ